MQQAHARIGHFLNPTELGTVEGACLSVGLDWTKLGETPEVFADGVKRVADPESCSRGERVFDEL